MFPFRGGGRGGFNGFPPGGGRFPMGNFGGFGGFNNPAMNNMQGMRNFMPNNFQRGVGRGMGGWGRGGGRGQGVVRGGRGGAGEKGSTASPAAAKVPEKPTEKTTAKATDKTTVADKTNEKATVADKQTSNKPSTSTPDTSSQTKPQVIDQRNETINCNLDKFANSSRLMLKSYVGYSLNSPCFPISINFKPIHILYINLLNVRLCSL